MAALVIQNGKPGAKPGAEENNRKDNLQEPGHGWGGWKVIGKIVFFSAVFFGGFYLGAGLGGWFGLGPWKVSGLPIQPIKHGSYYRAVRACIEDFYSERKRVRKLTDIIYSYSVGKEDEFEFQAFLTRNGAIGALNNHEYFEKFSMRIIIYRHAERGVLFVDAFATDSRQVKWAQSTDFRPIVNTLRFVPSNVIRSCTSTWTFAPPCPSA
ncbi:MAG: hypothetical protein ACR2KT_11740 [Methylocella sp.]|nr:MAG: hypothetical protein DLM68_06820 [Hyphomicrobiales bacterium]